MIKQGARHISRRVEIIRNGVVAGELLARDAPRVSADSRAELKMWLSGSFTPSSVLDAANDTLRPVLIIDGTEYPLGEYVISSAREITTDTGRQLEIEAYDRGLLLQQARIETRFFLAAGTLYTNAIQAILVNNGIASAIIEPSTATLATDREDWEIGTDWLTVVNDLLAEINYAPLWFDLSGIARLQKVVQPSVSTIAHTYESGELSIISAGCETELDLYDAPNVFIAMVSSPDYEAPITATAINDNAASALSTVRRGRRIVAPIIKLDNIASQEALQEYVDNVCSESMLSTETVSFYTANNPVHGIGDIIALKHPQMNGIYKEVGWSITLDAGAQMEHTARRSMAL